MVFLFLIPAISMRVFSDEIKSGMMELLIVRPISLMQLIWAKFFGTFTVVIFSILPTSFICGACERLDPGGNLDWGAAIGSFVGLLAIGAAYTAVALMASALTPNNVVAFVLGVALNFGMYLGLNRWPIYTSSPAGN